MYESGMKLPFSTETVKLLGLNAASERGCSWGEGQFGRGPVEEFAMILFRVISRLRVPRLCGVFSALLPYLVEVFFHSRLFEIDGEYEGHIKHTPELYPVSDPWNTFLDTACRPRQSRHC